MSFRRFDLTYTAASSQTPVTKTVSASADLVIVTKSTKFIAASANFILLKPNRTSTASSALIVQSIGKRQQVGANLFVKTSFAESATTDLVILPSGGVSVPVDIIVIKTRVSSSVSLMTQLSGSQSLTVAASAIPLVQKRNTVSSFANLVTVKKPSATSQFTLADVVVFGAGGVHASVNLLVGKRPAVLATVDVFLNAPARAKNVIAGSDIIVIAPISYEQFTIDVPYEERTVDVPPQ